MRGTSFLVAASLCLASAGAMAGDFLIGGDYPLKPSEQISALFYESGLNCIRLTGGGYSWSVADHKKLASDFQERGLKVYLQLGSHYPSADYFGMKDAWFVDHAGKTGEEDRKAWSITYSGHHWPQYSYAYLPFREKLEKDFTSYLSNFKSYSNVAGVILHNEPGLFWQADRIFDYGGPSLTYFRKYLQEQYGDIDALNRTWGTEYKSFEEATPPSKVPTEDVAAWMDFRRSQAKQIGDFMSWEAAFFKEQRTDIPRTTNLAGPLDHWYGYRCADNHLTSRDMDAVGVDIYPTQWSSRALVPYTMDLSHGVAQGREVHVLECDVFSVKQWKDFSETQRADMLRGELWTMIGHGARAVLMWGFSRGDQFSLTNGDANERYLAAREIAHYGKMIGIDGFTRMKPRVAVCVDTDSYIYASGIESKPHQLSPGEDAEAHGLYSMLADSQIAADVIFARQLTEGVTKEYDAIVMASPRMMDAKTAQALNDFTQGGGVLLASEPFATMDRWGRDLPADFPKPKATLLGDRAGAKYMQKADAAVRDRVASAVAPFATRTRVQVEPRGQAIDASLMQDGKSNVLVVVSTLGDKGKAAPAVDDVKLRIWTDQSPTAAFLLAATQAADGTTRTGPQSLEMQREADGAIVVSLEQLVSSKQVLFTTDADPLISIECPAIAKPGDRILARVSIANPGLADLRGELSGPGVQTPLNVVIAAGKTSTMPMVLGVMGEGRTVLTAQLRTASGTTLSIPVDVNVPQDVR